MLRNSSTVLMMVVVRAGALLLLEQGFLHLVHLDGDDTGLGSGLLWFAVAALASLAWGAWDAWRIGFAQAAVVWVVSGIPLGALVPVLIQVGASGGPQITWAVLWHDMSTLTPFLAHLVSVPALLAAGLTVLATGEGRTARR